MRIQLDWPACPVEIANMERYPVGVTGRAKSVDEKGERIRSGKQELETPERLLPCCGELVKEFLVELEDDFSLDSFYRNCFSFWDQRITPQNFQTCVYALPTQYMAELYRLIKWADVYKSTVVEYAWKNRRALPGALGGAWIGTRYRKMLPTDRWIHMLDMPENSFFSEGGSNLSTTRLGHCCGEWRFELHRFDTLIQQGEYVILLRQLTTEPPWQRHGWT